MNLKKPVNENYAAVVTTIRAINKLDNCDNVVAVPIFGYQAIVSKDTQVGDLVLVFTAETQLSDEYTKANNLYRDSTLNVDPTAKGYIESNRRVKAVKFRGHRSDALVMSIRSLEFTGVDVSELKDGDVFDELAGVSICKKYEVVKKNGTAKTSFKEEKFKRIDNKFFPEHYSTAHWFRQMDHIPDDATIVITQKLHSTSGRIGHVPVRRELNWKEKIAKFFGVKVAEMEYDHVYGSRRVIKDVNNPNQEHFYKDDVWTAAGKKLDSMIPQNFILYGEILGWTEDGSPLQSGYTYNLPQKQSEFYVYRILVLTNDGRHIELSWEAVKRFCKDNGIKYVPELFVGTKKEIVENGIIESLMDIRYYDEYKAGRIPFNEEPVPLSDKGTVDEGVCIRVVECEAVHPTILKAKAPMFLAYETKQLDAEVVDLESES